MNALQELAKHFDPKTYRTTVNGNVLRVTDKIFCKTVLIRQDIVQDFVTVNNGFVISDNGVTNHLLEHLHFDEDVFYRILQNNVKKLQATYNVITHNSKHYGEETISHYPYHLESIEDIVNATSDMLNYLVEVEDNIQACYTLNM